ncbi:RidA family protein [Demequina aurantiaca]|uniref:RidA family protein n=1 Tax=Demequina aurantiaca TaxID=676200 RepID=UPI00078604D8|nr:RidA family protein [Demequina aurantiaca]
MRHNFSSGGPFEAEYGYSRAVRVGNQVWVSGSCARGDAVDGDAYVQSVDALRVIAGSLAEAGASLADVVRTVTYVTDIADMPLVARAHREAFGEVLPAATIVEVSAFADARYKVEIQVDAVVDGLE